MLENNVNNTQDFGDNFKALLLRCDKPPFLFVGSGLSIRYCSIPTWINLLKGFVENNNDCFQFEFGYYSSKCSNDPVKIASSLAVEFHEHWWTSDKFKDNRKKFSSISGLDTEIAFKIELSQFVDKCQRMRDGFEEEIELISESVVSGILTTNWDYFLQNQFSEFQVQIGQKEAIFADQKSIGELYKIHGCTSRPETLVVTEKDYKRFIDNNHYLNAKLLTLFAEFPIIFMGYSLSDSNIERIFENLISCLDNNLFHVEKLQNRLFFIEWSSTPDQPSIHSTTYTLNSITIPLTKIICHDFRDIWKALSELPRTLPVKMLRHLQKMIYEFVSNSSPTSKILVKGMEELEEIEDLEVVVGFGNISKLGDRGIIGLSSKDLMRDILFNDLHKDNYPAIVENLLPSVVKKNVYIPFFKYQRGTDNLNVDNSLKSHTGNNFTLNRSKSITMEDYRIESGRKRTEKLLDSINSIEELIAKFPVPHAFFHIPFLAKEKINPDKLLPFLKEKWNEFGENEKLYSSPYRKCICLLDYLKYANHKEE